MALTIDLEGKVAAVTGVSSGIGIGIARQLARAGCDVAGCARSGPDSDGARAFADAVSGEGRTPYYVQADVSDAESPARFVDAAYARFGRLDTVISNAGRNVFEGAAECSLDAWQQCMDLDLRAHWLLAKASYEYLRSSSDSVPSIIVNGSNHAWSSIPGCFPYNAAKAALLGLVQSLAIEWGPRIRAVGIAPGFIDTPGNDTWFQSFDDPAEARRKTEAIHPAGRIGTVDEIGAICAFLASPHASFITGVTLPIDGGRSALMQDGAREYA